MKLKCACMQVNEVKLAFIVNLSDDASSDSFFY